MSREIPKHVHTFDLVSTNKAAITYHLRPVANGNEMCRSTGWALATVNDATLELNIQSDWGNWSYRWGAGGMATGADGRRCTLTEFIADRDEGHCDYLADKLTSYEERHQFDADASVKAMRTELVDKRIKQARAVIEWYQDDDPEDREDIGTDEPHSHIWERHKVRCKYTYKDDDWFLTKATTRSLYDDLGGLSSANNHDEFVNAFFQIEGHSIVSIEPWHGGDTGPLLIYEPSPHYYQLLHGILPALVRACAKTVLERESNAPCMAPTLPQAVAP